jgi:hypothetical protein
MERRELRNALLCVCGEGLWGFQSSMVATATVLTVLLARHGASQRMIGAITSIEGGMVVIPQFLGLYLFTSRRRRKRQLVLWHFVAIIPFLFVNAAIIHFGPRFGGAFVRWALLASLAGMMTGMGVIVGVWMDWMACLFHTGIRGRVMGVSFFSAAFFGGGGALLAGWVLKLFPGDNTYAVLYAVAGVVAFASLATFAFLRDPAEHETVEPPGPSIKDYLRRFGQSLRDKNFRRFLVGRMLASFGFCVVPFIAVYYGSAEGGSLADATVVSCGAAMTVGMAVAHLVLGKLGDRSGHRAGIVIGAAMQVAAIIVLFLTPGWWGCVLTYVCAGVCVSAGYLSHSNMLFETCPHDHRLAHITVGNFVMGAPLIVAPLLAGLAAHAWGLKTMFLACLFFSIAAVMWFALAVKEPRTLAAG